MIDNGKAKEQLERFIKLSTDYKHDDS
jgi:hypothetical protein